MFNWDTSKNILCIRLDTIGDVIMTIPAMAALKAAQPQRRLTLMTSTAGAKVAPLIPVVDDLIVYDAPWLKATDPRINSTPEFDMIERLRQANFDAAVIFTVYSQNPLPSAFLCYMAGIPLRLAHCHENPYQLLTNWIKDPEPEQQRHEVKRQLDLVANVLAGDIADADCTNTNRTNTDCTNTNRSIDPLLHISATAIQQAQIRLVEQGVDLTRPWLVIHPGATAASRRYSPEQFAIVATQLARIGFQIVFSGTQPEVELVHSIQQQMQMGSFSLAARLNLEEFAALIGLAPLLISNNTAPVHLAAVLGTPVVDLYALTNMQHTPWNVPYRVLFYDVPCRLCYKSVCPEKHHNCLRLVEPETVVEAVIELWQQTQPQKSQLAILADVPM